MTTIRVTALLALAALSACASGGPSTSYVSDLSAPTDASVIAAGISAFMRTQLPAASTTLVLEPTSRGSDNTLAPALADTLRQQGFAVADSAAPEGAHTLRYWVTPLDASGELVRLTIDGSRRASRFFVRNTAGTLQNGGPFTVMQAEAAP